MTKYKLVLYVMFRIEKHCLVKHFAFLKNVFSWYLNFVLRVTHCFLRAADWPSTNFLGMYCYFSVIRFSTLSVAPATVLALSRLRMNKIRKLRNFTNVLWGPSLNPPFSSWHCEVVSSLVFKISLRNLAIFPFLYAPLAVVTVFL